MKKLEIQYLTPEQITPYANNTRTHSPDQIEKIRASIAEFGMCTPIGLHNGVIVYGHARFEALKQLGHTEIPTVDLSHLTQAQMKAYVIADNRLALDAGWDDELLKVELEALNELDFDLDLLGFEELELDELLSDGYHNEDADGEIIEPPVEPVTKLWDVWILGKHRLMCGDSTSIDAVDKLMNGVKADMVFTDPPYNINYQDMKGEFDKIKNDKMSDSDFKDFLVQTIYPSDTMYVCCSWHYAHLFREAMIEIGKPPKAMIVWDKINPAQNLDKYFKQHEIIWYHGKFGGQKTLRGDVWQVKRQKNTVHPTMKPIELVEMAINDHPGAKIVCDLFGGSGSTLIACEKTARECRMMELDPKYCDVIINRWQTMTGQKAILESTGEPYAG